MHTDEIVVVAVALAALGFYAVAMAVFHLLLALRRRTERAPRSTPEDACSMVSILKPLAGADDDLRANLDSFAALRGRRYEVLFGVASESDEAYDAACDFIRRHPDVEARVVLTQRYAAVNPKIAQLIGLENEARGSVLVVSDSNVRVPPSYLDDLVGRLEDPRCGLVTSVFVGTGERTLGGALENLQLAATVIPSVVLSTCAKRPITVGKSMAMRREALRDLGGFAAFGDYLAEDYVMGRRFQEAGFAIATSFASVENRNVDPTVSRTFERHSRWAKLRRALSPTVFAIEPMLVPIVVATLGAILVPSRATLETLVAVVVVQTALAHLAVRVARGSWLPLRYLPLEIVRSFAVIGCWLSAWASMAVNWRGHRLVIGADSRLAHYDVTRTKRRRLARFIFERSA